MPGKNEHVLQSSRVCDCCHESPSNNGSMQGSTATPIHRANEEDSHCSRAELRQASISTDSPTCCGPCVSHGVAQPVSSTRNDAGNQSGSPGAVYGRSRGFTEPEAALSDFHLLRQIGKGSFGRVMQVLHRRNGKQFAMKILSKSSLLERSALRYFNSERRVLEESRHPFVVRLHSAFNDPNKFYLVLEFCPGRDLAYHLDCEGAHICAHLLS